MNLKTLFLTSALVFLPIGAIAKSNSNITCCKGSICVDSGDFIAEVAKVRNRGTIAIAQIQFVSKVAKLNMTFNNGYTGVSANAYGYSTLVDANGQEIKISGIDISNFELKQDSKQVVSFIFRSKNKKTISEPFDITVKTNSYEVTFFDLKTKNSKQSQENNSTQNK